MENFIFLLSTISNESIHTELEELYRYINII
jgi:hypothetical protein